MITNQNNMNTQINIIKITQIYNNNNININKIYKTKIIK